MRKRKSYSNTNPNSRDSRPSVDTMINEAKKSPAPKKIKDEIVMKPELGCITFKGCSHFRQRIVCATLSGKPIKITEIRAKSEEPGIRDFEASFLRLIGDKMTTGSHVEINHTGTTVYYKPGILTGGFVDHNCGLSRSIGWFLEGLVCLAPFGKERLIATLEGITNDNEDPSIDIFRTVTLPQLRHFGVDARDLEFQVVSRGVKPEGGGKVILKCPVMKTLNPIKLIEPGKIKRIRGIAFTLRVSPILSNRIVDGSKQILMDYTQDIYIYSDHCKGEVAGKSPGYGISLVAETTTGCVLGAEYLSPVGTLPEDLGKDVAKLMLQEISFNGCVDSSTQGVMLLWMVLSQESISKIRLGKLTPYTIKCLRNLKTFFGVTFKIVTEEESNTVILSCVGTGFENLSKRIF
eukprot:TRINITY_DN5676_c0_g1_i1.p1 TRINITY_DN5676_c0_g1~~TRINITY_DN5676_c0_g1_i1.p1  ORF type:complete len:419 (-),score=89.89 TRINITY_DN5676_c0_g1_i1:28-1245(-)